MTSGVELRIRLWNMVVGRFIFSSILHIWYVVVRISKSISGSPFAFEITRVDYILFSCKAKWGQWHQKGPERYKLHYNPFSHFVAQISSFTSGRSIQSLVKIIILCIQNSMDNKLTIFFLFFRENRLWHFMHIVSSGDNLHEMSIFWEK